MAATLDTLSEGRLDLGIGAGWYEPEYRVNGYEWRDSFSRLMRLDESIRVMKEMWTTQNPHFDGDYYTIEGARCTPRPIQDPHPPVLVGGSGEQITLKLVAKLADAWNAHVYDSDVSTLKQKISIIEQYCEDIERDSGEIEYSYAAYIICTRDDEKLEG